VAANIGSQDRMSYTLVGETVNIASRIQAVNKTSGTDILISDATRQGLKNNYYLKPLRPVSLKGVSQKAFLSAIL
jgi:adenylate cyclase